MEQKNWTVPPQETGKRIDLYLTQNLDITRSAAQKWLEQGLVTLETSQGPKTLGKSYKVMEGDRLTAEIPEPVEYAVKAEKIPLDIVYEDRDLLVVNKPKGMVVHPAPGNGDGTLVNALLAHCGASLSGINGVLRPGIVHRIDKDTSGLLIVAKNDRAHQGLAEQIKEHSFTRIYEAVVCGHLREPAGVVDAPIGRHPTDRKKMTVTQKNSKPARTHYTVLEEFPGTPVRPGFSYLRLRLETGRTHQIRVHMAYLGHPVAGDTVYGHGKQPDGLHGQCLHARVIGFIHPITGKYLEFSSPLPAYFTNFLEQLRENGL